MDVGIVVKDIARSLTFYEELLGLRKLEEIELPFGRMHRLCFGESFVKLIDPKEVPPAGSPGLATSLGFRYLTFPISNIDEMCERAERAEVPVEMSKREIMPGVVIVMLRDPDGNVVELVQRY